MDPTGGQAAQLATSTALSEKMSYCADLDLCFGKAGTEGQETLPAHSLILKLSSDVLAHAIDALGSSHSASSAASRLCRSNSSSGGQRQLLPLPGTTKADFLTVAAFLYPIAPLPKVTWDNLEVLLVEGNKWNITAVLAQVAYRVGVGYDKHCAQFCSSAGLCNSAYGHASADVI